MRFGLIGHPLTGSGSPALFAKAYGGKWEYDLIDEPSFEAAWGQFLADYEAVNVTAPFKTAAYERVAACGRLSEDALAAGAVNIVVKKASGDGGSVCPGNGGAVRPGCDSAAPVLAGYNSDYLGLKALLSAEGFGAGDVAVVAGFGGAGRAAAAAARALGMDVVVCNRTVAAPGGLPGQVSPTQIRPLAELPVLAGVADIVIYTLPVAVPEVEGLLAVASAGPSAGSGTVPVVLEANYVSPCLENYGGRYISGKRWLLEQARAGYAIMTGEKPVL